MVISAGRETSTAEGAALSRLRASLLQLFTQNIFWRLEFDVLLISHL